MSIFSDKSKHSGIAVFIDNTEGFINPVSLELLGKAKELAKSTSQPVYAVLISGDMEKTANEILYYAPDEVFVFENAAFSEFRIEPYTKAMEFFIEKVKPSAILVGATNAGRSLAPRIAARFKTGSTADCTGLEIKENSDLIQIRPAFGGNLMSDIITPNHRPQICTVRNKVFDMPIKNQEPSGKITKFEIPASDLISRIEVLEVIKKEKNLDLTTAERIVVAGCGFREKKDLELLFKLAVTLDAQVGVTRPLADMGWMDVNCQVGLTGKMVSPKLLIAIGVSGAIQFMAGVKGAECIVAINIDENAPIMSIANYAVKGDLYEVLPRIIEKIKKKSRKDN